MAPVTHTRLIRDIDNFVANKKQEGTDFEVILDALLEYVEIADDLDDDTE